MAEEREVVARLKVERTGEEGAFKEAAGEIRELDSAAASSGGGLEQLSEKSADAAIRSGVRLRMAVRFNVAILRETWTKRGLRGDLDESTATALAHGLCRLWELSLIDRVPSIGIPQCGMNVANCVALARQSCGQHRHGLFMAHNSGDDRSLSARIDA